MKHIHSSIIPGRSALMALRALALKVHFTDGQPPETGHEHCDGVIRALFHLTDEVDRSPTGSRPSLGLPHLLPNNVFKRLGQLKVALHRHTR